MTVRAKTARSGVVVLASTVFSLLLRVVSLIILARLLEPADFGVVSLAMVLISATQLFSGLGMRAAIIATHEDVHTAAFHGAVITVISGAFFMLIVMALAPSFAAWFDAEQLASITRWMAIAILFQTLCIVPDALLSRDMMFGRAMLSEVAASLGSVVLMVSLAYLGYGVWSLAIGKIVEAGIRFGVLVFVSPTLAWLRSVTWNVEIAKVLTRFGLTTTYAGFVRFIYDHGDNVIVGKLLGTTSLGFYTQAFNLANIPVTAVSNVANAVLFPAYTTIRNDPRRLAAAFLDTFSLVAVVSVPMAIGLLIMAPDIVILLLGDKWRNSIPVLQAFSLLAVLRPLSRTTSSLFLSVSRPDFNLRTAVLQCISMMIMIFIFLPLGAPGVALGVGGGFFLGFIYNLYLACRCTGVPLQVRQVLARLVPVSIASSVMAGVLIISRPSIVEAFGGVQNLFSVTTMIIGGVVIYGITLFAVKPSVVFDIIDLARSLVSREKAQSPVVPSE